MERGARPKRYNKVLHSKEREIVNSVISACDEEAKNKCLLVSLNKATERAAIYTGVSKSSIERLRRNSREHPDDKPSTPSKRRPKKARKVYVDSFDRRVIRDVIAEFYLVKKIAPTVGKLMPILRERIGWKWSQSSLRRLLKDMGFVWKRSQKKRKFLVERVDVVNCRSKYITTLKKLREEGRETFYLDETWVDANLTFKKCWQKEGDVEGMLESGNAGNRLIVVHIGSSEGFLAGSLLIYKASATTGDYHGQMNAENFEKWVTQKVLPNLPPNAVIVMDNAPYHSKVADKPPSDYSVKQDMIDWLQSKGVACDSSMRKVTLIELLNQHRPKQKTFAVDKLFQQHGHTVVRLPPYMCELNAVELAWAKVKHYVRSHNTSGELSLSVLQRPTTEAVEQVSKEDWVGFCSHVKKIEDEYWEKDHIIEIGFDEFLIHVGGDSLSDDTSDSNSDQEEYSDHERFSDSDDSTLAQLLSGGSKSLN